jgi:hypothetical protein
MKAKNSLAFEFATTSNIGLLKIDRLLKKI